MQSAGSRLTTLYFQGREAPCCPWSILPHCFIACASFGFNWEFMPDQSALNATEQMYKKRIKTTSLSIDKYVSVRHQHVLLGVVKDLWKLLTRGSGETFKNGEHVRLSKATQDRIVRETKLLKLSAAFPRGFLNVV
jgi:hypothetical protein